MDGFNLDAALELVNALTRRPRGVSPESAPRPVLQPTARMITPAATEPAVTQLPRTGTGLRVQPPAPPVQPARPASSPGDALGSATSGVLGALGDKLGGGLGMVAQAGPIEAAGSTGLFQGLGAGVSTALTAGQAAVISDFGEDAYRYVADPNYTKSALGGAVVQENLPVIRNLLAWSRANPEKVKAAYEQGFADRTGDQQFTGGRAVWEAYARENLTGNLEGAIATTLTDPLNAIPGMGKGAGVVRRAGVSIAREAAETATRSALREATAAGVTKGDELAAAATKDLLSGNPVQIQDVLTTISPELAREFAAGTFRLADVPAGVEGLARAAAYNAAKATAIPDQGLLRLGKALELGGKAVEIPAKALDEAPGRIAGALLSPVKSRVPARLARWAENDPRTQASQALGTKLSALDFRNWADARQREFQAMLGPEVAALIAPPAAPTFPEIMGTQQTLGTAPPTAAAAPAPAPVVRAADLVGDDGAPVDLRIPGLYIRDDSTPTTPKFQVVDGDSGTVVTAIDFPRVEDAQDFIARRGAPPATAPTTPIAEAVAPLATAPSTTTALLERPEVVGEGALPLEVPRETSVADLAAPAVEPRVGDDLASLAVAEAAPPLPVAAAASPPYQEAAPTGRSSIANADARIATKFDELRNGADPATLARIDSEFEAMTADMQQLRQESAGGDRARIRANHADFWVYEFRAERAAREARAEAGLPAVPHINREVGGLAKALDTLAWNPDDDAAEAARRQLDAEVAKAEPQTAAPAIQRARDEVEEFRTSRFATTIEEPAAAVAEAVEEVAPTLPSLRPPQPNPVDDARLELTLHPEATGAVMVPIDEIRTDPARFQPRGQLNRAKVDLISNTFDWQKFHPMKLWRDPTDGEVYVLEGHHRLEGARQRGDITDVKAEFFTGSEDEAIAYARTSNSQLPESPLERAATVRHLFDEEATRRGLDPNAIDEVEVLSALDLPNVVKTERQKLLNLTHLPRPIADELTVHPNAGKGIIDAHAKLGSRIDPHARPRNGMQTVTPQEAEGLYRALQKQKRKKADDPLPTLSPEEITRVVDGIDAMTGMNRQDQLGMFAGMTTNDGRAAEFLAANAEMIKRNKALAKVRDTYQKAMTQAEREIAELEAATPATATDMFGDDIPVENVRLAEKREAYAANRRQVAEAEAALQDAQQQGMRLTENNKNADDFTDWQLGVYFGPTPHDIRRAVQAGRRITDEVWDWSDQTNAQRAAARAENAVLQAGVAKDAGVAGGAVTDARLPLNPIIPQEVSDLLATPFGPSSTTYQGRGFGEVADEIGSRIRADKQALLDLLAQPTSALDRKQTIQLNKLTRQYGVTNRVQAAALEPRALMRRELKEAINEEFGVKPATGVGRLLDKLSAGYSALSFFTPWSLGRYFIGNAMGDSWQVALLFGPEAAARMNDPRQYRHMFNYAVRGGDPMVGAVGDHIKASGVGGYHQRLVSENMAEAILGNEQKQLRRVGGKAKFNWIGEGLASTKNPVNIARNMANGMEWSRRSSLWAHQHRMRVIAAKVPFSQEMSDLALKNGIAGDEVLKLMDSLNPVVDGAEVAQSFANLATMRGRTAAEAAGFGEEMGRKWASKVYQANEEALDLVDDALFSYAQTNADGVIRRVIPFHWWMSRAIPFYAEQMVRHPGFTAAYNRLWQATQEQAEAEGWPASLQMFTKAFGLPGGAMLMVNPLAAVGLLDVFVEQEGGYTEENVSAIGKVLAGASQFGVGLLPWWGAMLNHLGYLGESPFGLDPIGLHQTRNFVGTMVQLLAGEGVLGEDAQILQSKPYEDRLQDARAFFSSFGLPGSYHIDAGDPNNMPAVMIRNMMLRALLEHNELTHDQYLTMGMRAQQDPTSPEGVLFEEINDTVAEQELDAGPLYRAAVRDYSRANAITAGVRAISTGLPKMKQEEQLATQALNNALSAPIRQTEPTNRILGGGLGPTPATTTGQGFDQAIRLGVDANDAEFARQWQQRFGETFKPEDLDAMRKAASQANQLGNASPEAAPLLNQQEARNALGSDRARELLEEHTKIGLGERHVSLKDLGIKMSQMQMARLDEDSRWAIADAWLEYHDTVGQAAQLRELRDLYDETHPERGAFAAWQSDTRKQWGGARNFRLAAARENPNYAAYIERETAKLRKEGTSPSVMLEELDRVAMNVNGYLAYQGIAPSRYDPAPRQTGAPLPLASEGAPLDALGGGGGFGMAESNEDRVRRAISETDIAVGVANRYLGQNIMQIPPQWREALMSDPNFPEAGLLPEDAWIYENYVNFVIKAEREGTDPSIEAFIASQGRQRPTNAPVLQAYQPGTWPPQPALATP